MGWTEWLRSSLGLGRLARRRSSAEPRIGARLVGPLPLSLQLQRIGGSLTPQEVSTIIREADSGRVRRLVDLANDARQKDGHLQCVLGTRENALAGLEWACEPPQKSRAVDRKAAAWMTEALQQAQALDADESEVRGFFDAVAHITGAAYHGHAVCETMLAKDAGKLVPTGWTCIAPRRFEYDQRTGRLHWHDDVGMPSPGVDLMKAYPGKFIQHQPRINGDVPCREGLARVLMWVALFRNWDVRDWLTLAELAWKPWRVGKYKRGTLDKDIAALEEALDQMSASGTATLPESVELLIEWPRNPPAQSSTHQALAEWLGAEMSKAVLGQTLTTEQGQKGSQALGRVHDDVRRDILEADARSVAATIRRHLIAPLVRLNFGDDVMVPGFRFLTEDAPDLKTFAEGVTTLAPWMPIPAAWVRDRAGMPEPDGDEEVLEMAVEVDTSELDEPDGEEPTPDEHADEKAAAAA